MPAGVASALPAAVIVSSCRAPKHPKETTTWLGGPLHGATPHVLLKYALKYAPSSRVLLVLRWVACGAPGPRSPQCARCSTAWRSSTYRCAVRVPISRRRPRVAGCNAAVWSVPAAVSTIPVMLLTYSTLATNALFRLLRPPHWASLRRFALVLHVCPAAATAPSHSRSRSRSLLPPCLLGALVSLSALPLAAARALRVLLA